MIPRSNNSKLKLVLFTNQKDFISHPLGATLENDPLPGVCNNLRTKPSGMVSNCRAKPINLRKRFQLCKISYDGRSRRALYKYATGLVLRRCQRSCLLKGKEIKRPSGSCCELFKIILYASFRTKYTSVTFNNCFLHIFVIKRGMAKT
jgi:hypothetical protein